MFDVSWRVIRFAFLVERQADAPVSIKKNKSIDYF
jgi:hypothetical protein